MTTSIPWTAEDATAGENVRLAAPEATEPVASPSDAPDESLSVTLIPSPLQAALMLLTFSAVSPYRLFVASQLGAPKAVVTPSVSHDATTVALSPTVPVVTPPRVAAK